MESQKKMDPLTPTGTKTQNQQNKIGEEKNQWKSQIHKYSQFYGSVTFMRKIINLAQIRVENFSPIFNAMIEVESTLTVIQMQILKISILE